MGKPFFAAIGKPLLSQITMPFVHVTDTTLLEYFWYGDDE